MAAEDRGGSGVALVTGAPCGIGFEVARQLAPRGMTVILVARDPKKGEAAARRLADEGLDVRAKPVDVADGGSVNRLAAEVDEEFGCLDVLVNNAAAYADWSETASTADLESPVRSWTRTYSARGGAAAASCGVSKVALNALTAKLATELDGAGVLVNSFDPGLTATAHGMEEMGARPVPEGTASVVWAATLPDDGPTGGFFRDGEPLPW